MSEQSSENLRFTTLILRARIACKSTVDVDILDFAVAEEPRFLDEHLGRIVEFFGPMSDLRLAFFMFWLTGSSENISDAIMFNVHEFENEVDQQDCDKKCSSGSSILFPTPSHCL